MLTPIPSAQRGARRLSPSGKRAVEHAVLGLLPVLVVGLAFYYAFSGGYAAGDFQHTFLVVGWRELHGGDPYSWTRSQIAAQLSFPYPALTVVLLEPLAILPGGVATVLYLVLCAAAIFGTLALLGVRDWRVYGLTVLSSPVLIGWQTGNFTLPLVLGVAAAWRYRDRPWVLGLIAAVLVSIKPIMLPIVLWLIATRRYTATSWAVAWGLVLNLLAWTMIGWGEFSRWLHLVSTQSAVMYRDGYGIIALLADAGVHRALATGVVVVISLGACLLCLHLARARKLELEAFIVSVGMMLVCSPKIDQHYFALLLVPLALVRPRLSWLWAVPLLVWVCPATDATAWQIAVWWLLAVAVLWRTIRLAREPRGVEPLQNREASPKAIRRYGRGVVA